MEGIPLMRPCSQSTMIQSAPARARALEMLAPGSICQNPIAGPLPAWKTLRSRLAPCILAEAVLAS
jgi:hypothetical protein